MKDGTAVSSATVLVARLQTQLNLRLVDFFKPAVVSGWYSDYRVENTYFGKSAKMILLLLLKKPPKQQQQPKKKQKTETI